MKASSTTRSIGWLRVWITFPLGCIVLFSGCEKKNLSTAPTIHDSIFMEAGSRISAVTFDSLRSSLLKAINTGGLPGAISFCNIKASEITQRHADTFLIKRTALRYRNTNNKPDSIELTILQQMVDEMGTIRIPKSRVVRDENAVHYFRPIILQGMCLSCHGKPREQIPVPTLNEINRLYPTDQAIDFKEGDLRGLWHITFNLARQRSEKSSDLLDKPEKR
jgi:hypothetical protein